MKKIVVFILPLLFAGVTVSKAQGITPSADGTFLFTGTTAATAGLLAIGPKTGWLQIDADPTGISPTENFYFNRAIYIAGGKLGSYNAPLTFVTTSLSSMGYFSYATRLTIDNLTGNVGIGTTTTGTCKLAVEGKIGCREIDVVIPGTVFPDYVFEKNYKILPLADLENFLSVNKHLPNIPSALDVQNNENKINLGDMQVKQLEKIEELTLYIIELNKKIEVLDKKMNEKK
jgi:hypothetical protein